MHASTLLAAALVATIALIQLQPTSATFSFSWNYFYWKKECYSDKPDKPDYEEKRPDNKKFKGSPCSEGGVCDVVPCGLDDFEDCPCVFDDDDEGYPFHYNTDYDDDEDDDNDGRRRKRSYNSYIDNKGYTVYYKYNNYGKKLYWFYKDNKTYRFYARDNRRCYYYYSGDKKYEYYIGSDQKRHYYDKDGNTNTHSGGDSYTDSDSHSHSHSHSHSSSDSSHSDSHSSSHSSNSGSRSGSRSRNGCDSGGIGGPKGHRKVCFAFTDAYCPRHGFAIGYRQECLRGQDRCIMEIDDKGLYHRRCGAASECEDLGLIQENCTHAGCKLFDCKATGCTYTMAQKNFFSFTRDGNKCGCDGWCWETYINRDDCCPDACTLCTEGATPDSHCPQTVETPQTTTPYFAG